MVDYPEAVKLAGVTSYSSPVTLAKSGSLGDTSRHPRRLWSMTKALIEEVKREADPAEGFCKFATLSNKKHLAGATQLIWDGWDHSEPSIALCFDLLHSSHKFWKDHPFQWAKKAIGALEMDLRFKSLHDRIGWRHFSKGVTTLTKTGGRDHRDMQRYILCVIDGAVPPQFAALLRAHIDYSYIAQNAETTSTDLTEILRLIEEFHKLKDIVHNPTLRYRQTEGWRIPKLELQHHIVPSILALGCLLGLSTDISEHEHTQLIKEPFRRTNHRDFVPQMVQYLDRMERLRHFDLATALELTGSAEKLRREFATPYGESHRTSDQLEIQNYAFLDELATIQNLRGSKRPDFQNFFTAAKALDDPSRGLKYRNRVLTFQPTAFTAIHLNRQPTHQNMPIREAMDLYRIPDLQEAIEEFYYHSSQERDARIPQSNGPVLSHRRIPSNSQFTLEYDTLRIWDNVKVQTMSLLRPGQVNKATTIIAQPPGEQYTFGRCDCALFINDDEAPFAGRVTLEGKFSHQYMLVIRFVLFTIGFRSLCRPNSPDLPTSGPGNVFCQQWAILSCVCTAI
jgi:hypothetical protein